MNENFLRVMIIVQMILKFPDMKWKKELRINGPTKENDGIALWMHSWGIRLKLVFWEDGHPFPECCIYAKSVTIIHSYFCNRYVQICRTKGRKLEYPTLPTLPMTHWKSLWFHSHNSVFCRIRFLFPKRGTFPLRYKERGSPSGF